MTRIFYITGEELSRVLLGSCVRASHYRDAFYVCYNRTSNTPISRLVQESILNKYQSLPSTDEIDKIELESYPERVEFNG